MRESQGGLCFDDDDDKGHKSIFCSHKISKKKKKENMKQQKYKRRKNNDLERKVKITSNYQPKENNQRKRNYSDETDQTINVACNVLYSDITKYLCTKRNPSFSKKTN